MTTALQVAIFVLTANLIAISIGIIFVVYALVEIGYWLRIIVIAIRSKESLRHQEGL